MKTLIKIYGKKAAKRAVKYLQNEVPNMDNDYYIRNAFRILAE